MQALSQLSYTPTAKLKVYGGPDVLANRGRGSPAFSGVRSGCATAIDCCDHGGRRAMIAIADQHRPSHAAPRPPLIDAPRSRRTRGSRHRCHRRARTCGEPRMRARRRHRGAARTRGAQARDALRRDRAGRASRTRDPAARLPQRRYQRVQRRGRRVAQSNSAGSMRWFMRPHSLARWAPSSTNPSSAGWRCGGSTLPRSWGSRARCCRSWPMSRTAPWC